MVGFREGDDAAEAGRVDDVEGQAQVVGDALEGPREDDVGAEDAEGVGGLADLVAVEVFAGRDPGAGAAGDLVEAEAEMLGQAGGEDAVLGAVADDGRGEDGDVSAAGGLGEAEKDGDLAGEVKREGGGEEGGPDREGRDSRSGRGPGGGGGAAEMAGAPDAAVRRWPEYPALSRTAARSCGHLDGGRVARGDVLGQGLFEDGGAAGGRAGREEGEGFRLAVDDVVGERVFGRAVERELPGEHLVEDDAERPDVGAGVDVLAAELFGRHVGDGADGAAGAGQAGLAGDLGQAEVGDAGRPVLGDEDVGRLDVAVDDAARVGGGQAVGDLGGDGQGLGRGQGAALDLGPQALAAAEGHGDEHAPVLALADLVDGADVRVVEDGGGLGLVDEALAGLGVVDELRGQELEGDGAAELEVVGLVDDAHAAAADLAEEAIFAGDDGAGEDAAGERVDGRGEGGRIGGRGGGGGGGAEGRGRRRRGRSGGPGGRVRRGEQGGAAPAVAGRVRIRGTTFGAFHCRHLSPLG